MPETTNSFFTREMFADLSEPEIKKMLKEIHSENTKKLFNNKQSGKASSYGLGRQITQILVALISSYPTRLIL